MEEESTPYGGEFSEGAPWKGNLRSLWNGQEPEKGTTFEGGPENGFGSSFSRLKDSC